jgi:hypothetical protein
MVPFEAEFPRVEKDTPVTVNVLTVSEVTVMLETIIVDMAI